MVVPLPRPPCILLCVLLRTNLRDGDGFAAGGGEEDSRDGNDVGEVVELVRLEAVGLAGARDEAVHRARARHKTALRIWGGVWGCFRVDR